MDHHRFDMLTRNLAAASRRGLLARLATGLLVALPLTRGNDDAAAKSCPPCRKKKKGKCRKKRPDGTPCGNGGRCQDGGCDHNVCTLNCAGSGGGQPQACGPADSGCQCVNAGDGVGACVKTPQGASFSAEAACEEDQIFGIPCTTYVPSCWAPCV